MKKKGLSSILFILLTFAAMAQEAEKKEKEEALKGTHQLTVALGHSHLSEGVKENGKKGWKLIPSTGFDYTYWISNHWALGLHNDIMVETFEVEDHDNKLIERSTPFTSVIIAAFKPKKHMSYIAGMGAEFAKEEDFAVTRLGVEYGSEMKNNWEFGVSLLYDIKWGGYDTWVFAFSISKLLRKKHG